MGGTSVVDVVKVSVLKWNERLQNIKESQGLFMVCFKKLPDSTKESPGEDCYCVAVFDNILLSTPESTDWLVSNAMQGCLKHLSAEEDTRTVMSRLTTAISAYLLRYFRLNIDSDKEKMARVVTVVDLPMSMTKNNSVLRSRARTESSTRCECVSGKLGVQEVRNIRFMLMFLLKEPIVLWVRPLVRCEPTGLDQVEKSLS